MEDTEIIETPRFKEFLRAICSVLDKYDARLSGISCQSAGGVIIGMDGAEGPSIVVGSLGVKDGNPDVDWDTQ